MEKGPLVPTRQRQEKNELLNNHLLLHVVAEFLMKSVCSRVASGARPFFLRRASSA